MIVMRRGLILDSDGVDWRDLGLREHWDPEMWMGGPVKHLGFRFVFKIGECIAYMKRTPTERDGRDIYEAMKELGHATPR